MHNAVPDAVLFDERRNGACSPRGVDDVDVVVMAVGAALLRVDILPQRRVQQRTLQVVRGKSVARQQAVGIAIFDERLHGRLGRRVEAARRTEHPYHIAVLFFMAQQPGQCVIIPRESRFPAAPGAERERFGAFAARGKALRMHQNALAAIVRAAQHHAVALHKIAELHNAQFPVRGQNRHAVHTAFFSKTPHAVHFIIFRIHACGMIARRRGAVRRGRCRAHAGRIL